MASCVTGYLDMTRDGVIICAWNVKLKIAHVSASFGAVEGTHVSALN